MSLKKRILIVDDSPNDIHFVMDHFPDSYDIIAATSGQKALQLAAQEPLPDVILMDVEMTDMNGYETCRKLKSNPVTEDIDVIFVSSHDTVEEKLAGYEAGGSDYLSKPVNNEELLEKVKISVNNHQFKIKSKEERTQALETAVSAINNAQETGVIIKFNRECYQTSSFRKLTELLVNSAANYRLDNAVQIKVNDEYYYHSSNKHFSQLERELLTRFNNQNKYLEVKDKLIINCGHITQIVKHMPTEPQARKRLIDHLSVLIEIANFKSENLLLQQELLSIINFSNDGAHKIEAIQNEQVKQSVQIMDDLKVNMQDAFIGYGISETQEQGLLTMINQTIAESMKNIEAGKQISKEVNNIIANLSKVLKK
ncbi:MAG: response regulator [Gammaproteobacteria bacterium]|nr:response regulator [Gammaproteobacteria bacterium]